MKDKLKLVLSKSLAKENKCAGVDRLDRERCAEAGKGKEQERLITDGNVLRTGPPAPQNHEYDDPAQKDVEQIEDESVLEGSSK